MPEPLPDWLTGGDPPKIKPTPERRVLDLAQFEMVFPRVLEMIYEGYVLKKALGELPIEINAGAFMRWLKKDPQRYELYKEAKEVRTEVWTGEILKHALGETDSGDASLDDTSRSKLIVDTYKWLMGADNRKVYGDTKTVELNTNISITAALEQARGRVNQIVDAEYEVLSDEGQKLLTDGEPEEDE
jgi:hypothetical protein